MRDRLDDLGRPVLAAGGYDRARVEEVAGRRRGGHARRGEARVWVRPAAAAVVAQKKVAQPQITVFAHCLQNPWLRTWRIGIRAKKEASGNVRDLDCITFKG